MSGDIMNISNSMMQDKSNSINDKQDKRKEWTVKKQVGYPNNLKQSNKILFFSQLEKNIIWINNDLKYPKEKKLWYFHLNPEFNCCYGPFSSDTLISNIKVILNIPENYTRYEYTSCSYIGIRPIDIFKFNNCNEFEYIDITDLSDKKTLVKLERSDLCNFIDYNYIKIPNNENKIQIENYKINDLSIINKNMNNLNETVNDTIINATFMKNDIKLPDKNDVFSNNKNTNEIFSKTSNNKNIKNNNNTKKKKQKQQNNVSKKEIIKQFYKKDSESDGDNDKNLSFNEEFEDSKENEKSSTEINLNKNENNPGNILDEIDWVVIGSKSTKKEKNQTVSNNKDLKIIQNKDENVSKKPNIQPQINKVDKNIIHDLNPKNKKNKLKECDIEKENENENEKEVKLGFDYVGDQTFLQSQSQNHIQNVKIKNLDNIDDDFVIVNKKKKK